MVEVSGTVRLKDGGSEPVTAESLSGAPESALRMLAFSMVALAAALVVLRFA